MTRSRGRTSSRAEPSIGEPLLAADPLITSSQAAALLHDTRQRVQLLAKAGILTTHPGHHHRRYRMSDVTHLAEPMTVHEAIQLLGCTTDQLWALIHTRTLPTTGHPLRPVRRYQILWRRQLARPLAVRRPAPPADGHALIGLRPAAKLLGLSTAETKARAQDGKIPAIETAKRWRFRRDLLELVARAADAAESRTPRSLNNPNDQPATGLSGPNRGRRPRGRTAATPPRRSA